MSCILITGGNGFIGREISRVAVEDGHWVRSIARSGQPAIDKPWVEEVEWNAADVFEPYDWRDQLDGCDAVIHTIAAIRDSPEQGVTLERVNGDAAIIAGLEAALTPNTPDLLSTLEISSRLSSDTDLRPYEHER